MKGRFRTLFTLAALGILIANAASPMYAAKDYFSVSTEPALLEINAQAPALAEARILVQSHSNEAQVFDISFRTIAVPRLTIGTVEHKPESQLSELDVMMRSKLRIYRDDQPISSTTLLPNEEASFILKADIDSSIPQGDYYFTVLFISKPSILSQDNSTSHLSAGIGTNVLLTVGNPEKASGAIKRLSSPLFVTGGPVPISLLIENSSSHYINPKGRIMITDLFGNSLQRIDIATEHILGRSSRYMRANSPELGTLEFGQLNLLGIYTATAVVALSNDGPAFTQSTTFIAVPLIAYLILAVLAFITGGIYLKVRKRTEHNTKPHI